MTYRVRRALPEDLPAAVESEMAAMKGGWYLQDCSELFLNDRLGELLVAETETGEIVAVGKYTILYDHSAWLETLRVKPEHQRKGIGRLYYEEFERLSKHWGVPYMRMYTGATNVPSAALARLYGLETEAYYHEMSLDLGKGDLPEKTAGFVQVSEERACELLPALAEQWHQHIVLNRTFYPMNEALYRGLAREGKVWEDPESGSFMILGNRFLPRRSLMIGAMRGDLDRCLAFAKKECIEHGVPKLVIDFPPDDTALLEYFTSNGFVALPSDLMVMGGPTR